jgi:hypothetical protein
MVGAAEALERSYLNHVVALLAPVMALLHAG